MLFHEEEKTTTAVLEAYADSHPGALVRLEFAEGDVYKCRLDTAYESDNDLDVNDPDYDEYYELVYRVEEVVAPGPNCERAEYGICLNYRHFPVRVVAEDGTVIYRIPNERQ